MVGTSITLALVSSTPPPGSPSSIGVWTALEFRLRPSRPIELRVLIVRRLDTRLPAEGRLPRFFGAMLPVFPELVSVSGPDCVFRRSSTIANSSSSGIASSSSSEGKMSPLLLKLSMVSLLPAVPLRFLPCRLGALPTLPSLSSNNASPSPRSLPGRFAPGCSCKSAEEGLYRTAREPPNSLPKKLDPPDPSALDVPSCALFLLRSRG